MDDRRGGKSAWLAAFLTLASVAGGRIGGAYWWVNYGMDQHPDLAVEVPATRESYEATKRMAKEWTELAKPRSDEAVVRFMLEHRATTAWGMGTAWCLVFASGRRRRRR